MDNNKSCRYLLNQVNQIGLAMYDTVLYLDTHSCDSNALNYYKYISDMYDKAVKAYEAQCGPLHANNANISGSFEWINGPWPWEGVC